MYVGMYVFKKYFLSSFCVSGNILGTVYAVVSNTDTVPGHMQLTQ